MLRCAAQCSDEILRHAGRLSRGVLRGWGTWLPRFLVHNPGTIAQGPHTWVADDFQMFVDDDSPPLFFAG